MKKERSDWLHKRQLLAASPINSDAALSYFPKQAFHDRSEIGGSVV